MLDWLVANCSVKDQDKEAFIPKELLTGVLKSLQTSAELPYDRYTFCPDHT